MTEQIYEVRIIVRTHSIIPRTENEIQDVLHEALKWLEREDVKQITVTEVYKQTR